VLANQFQLDDKVSLRQAACHLASDLLYILRNEASRVN
jgi:hypothetical protein